MDVLQKQILDLTDKVDRLHEIVDRISNQLVGMTGKNQLVGNEEHLVFDSQNSYSYSHGQFKSAMEHKDIIFDDGDSSSNFQNKNEQNIAPDIQIRRLTAQLTAAYNRIAALEEQLLARRVKP